MKPSRFSQGSDGWHAERKGKLTASNFGAAAGINRYKSRLALWKELTGRPTKPITAEQRMRMAYGTKHEPIAISDYEITTGRLVIKCGFIKHPHLKHMGASPDGLPDDGTIEVKCKSDGSLHEIIPPYYLAQMYGVMECTQRKWCDFVSWSPSDLKIIRVQYDQKMWDDLLELLDKFWTHVLNDTEPKKLSKRPTWGM